MNKQESSYRWVVFGTALLAYYLIVSQRTAPGLITEQLMKDFHVSASVIGLMTSIQFLAYAGLQIPIGLLSDRYKGIPWHKLDKKISDPHHDYSLLIHD